MKGMAYLSLLDGIDQCFKLGGPWHLEQTLFTIAVEFLKPSIRHGVPDVLGPERALDVHDARVTLAQKPVPERDQVAILEDILERKHQARMRCRGDVAHLEQRHQLAVIDLPVLQHGVDDGALAWFRG